MVKSTTIQDRLVHLRRELHRTPELGFEEKVTRDILINALEAEGFEVKGPVARTGFYVDITGAYPGPKVAYRADIDALPIVDEKQVDYASRNKGKGHMCGHDVHSTIALGVAHILNEFRDKLHGSVRIFWQPAEETNPSGAPEIVKSGILDDVDAVYGIHCDPNLKCGTVCILSGMVTASFDKFDITVKAPDSIHSARPHQGSDTMWVTNKILSELYSLPGRLTNTLHPSVISVSKIHGGEVHNVIPQQISLGGTIRCSRHEDRKIIHDHIRKVLKTFSGLYDVSAEIQIGEGAPPVRNDDNLADAAKTVVQSHKEFTLAECSPSMGGEDFAHYSLEKPTLFMRVGTSSGPETSHPVHTSLFDIDETILEPASQLLKDILTHHLEHNTRTDART